MRILLTTDTVGGVWTFTCELTSQLLRLGHDVALLSFGREPSTWQQAWCDALERDFGTHFQSAATSVPLEWMQNNDRVMAEGTRHVLDMCERFAPDLLHSNQFCWGALNIAVPIVVTAHSDVLSWGEACRGELEENAWLQRYRDLVQDGLDGADAVTAPTTWMAYALARHFSVSAPVAVVANGRFIVPPTAERRLQAASVGRLWDKAKGVQTLLNLKSPMPLLIAGECNKKDAHQSGATRLLGALSSSDVLRLFSESSVYVAASVYEPFGLAPLEAAQCGCAIVARDLATFREVWGETAIYFKDTEELEQILVCLFTDEVWLSGARAAAFKRASYFSAERMASGYLSLYKNLVDAKIQQCQEGAVHVC